MYANGKYNKLYTNIKYTNTMKRSNAAVDATPNVTDDRINTESGLKSSN